MVLDQECLQKLEENFCLEDDQKVGKDSLLKKIMTKLESLKKNSHFKIVLKNRVINNDCFSIYRSKNFMDKNEESLDVEFSKLHEFQTSTRGIKVRGVFSTQEEAELRCKMLREVDPNHDIYVGPVGVWVPYHPEAYKTGKSN